MLIELSDTGTRFVEDITPPPLPKPRFATQAGAKPTLEQMAALIERLRQYEAEDLDRRRAEIETRLITLRDELRTTSNDDRRRYLQTDIAEAHRAVDRAALAAPSAAFDRVAEERDFPPKRWLPWLSRHRSDVEA